MEVLGVDPGSHHTGWGLVRSEGSTLRHVASGTLAAEGADLAERLRCIADGLEHVMARFQPDAAAIEAVFHAKNSRSALLLGHARGVALLCAARRGVPVFEYTAGQIKQAVTGRGRAAKNQVQEMVRLLLGHQEPMSLDTSDALAAGICHAQLHLTPTARWLQQATGNHVRSQRKRS